MKELYIVVGHYGSGKTEIALNLAVKLLNERKGHINLVDLDFINPYFRSRNFTEQYREIGINILSAEEHYRTLDMPALSPRIFGALQDEKPTIFDVGGDDVGALALGYFYNYISKMNYEMWYVINANRPMTATVDKAYKYLMDIEKASRLKITHLINNTHLMHETTIQDIEKGNELCRELSKICGLPIKYTVGKKEILENLVGSVEGKMFYIQNINSHLLWR